MDFKKRREGKMRKLLSGLLIVSLLLGVKGGESVFASEKKPKVIYIGSAYGGGYGKPFSGGTIGVIHVQGLLEEEFKQDGIKIEWYFFKGAGPAVNEAFANNTIDFAYQGDLPSIIGRAGGLRTKLIAGGSVRGNVYIGVPNDSPITSIKELKGRKVGIFKGTNAQLTFNRILEANGLTEKDFKLYNLGSADGEAALASKDIDGGVYWLNLLNLRTLGIARIIYSTKEAPDNWKNFGGLLVTEKFANEYPDIVKRVVKVYVKAAQWASEEKNRDELFQLWAKAGTPFNSIKEENEGSPLKLKNTPLLDEFYVKHYKEGVTFSKERGLIRNTFDVDKWIDKSYLEQALKELGLESYWPQFDAQGKEKGGR
jgi:sulfonate transport system substrate-binding protein